MELVFDKTPFYALSGGQVSDTGTVSSGDDSLILRVKDVYDYPDTGRVHLCEIEKGEFSSDIIKDNAVLAIDADKRRDTESNHSATHLLQAALQKVLGEHVRQSGSYVDTERLRFDFNHFAGMKPEEIEKVERIVIQSIMEDHQVEISEKTIEEARALGAMSLFEEKYGDVVRVVKIGDVSIELCGGTHVSRTGQIGTLRIVSESSVAAGIRRIEAVTGIHSYEMARDERNLVQTIGRELNTQPEGILERIDGLTRKVREMEKEIKRLKTEGSSADLSDIKKEIEETEGIRYYGKKVDVENVNESKSMLDFFRDKVGSGVVVLASNIDSKATIVASVTSDIIREHSIEAVDIVNELAKFVEGSGGGKPQFAMAGGKKTDGIDNAIKDVRATINTLVTVKGKDGNQ